MGVVVERLLLAFPSSPTPELSAIRKLRIGDVDERTIAKALIQHLGSFRVYTADAEVANSNRRSFRRASRDVRMTARKGGAALRHG
jgi:hypothetical protein